MLKLKPDVRDRLLDLIRIQNTRAGHIGMEYMIGLPVKDWPEYLQKNRWIWMGSHYKPRKHRQKQFRADPDNGIRPVIINADVRARPYFSVGGRNRSVTRLIYGLFIRDLNENENLRYIAEYDRDPMDVNPLHYEPYIRGKNRNKYIPVQPRPEAQGDDHLLPVLRPADVDLVDAMDTLEAENIKTKAAMIEFVQKNFPEDMELFQKAADRMKLDE